MVRTCWFYSAPGNRLPIRGEAKLHALLHLASPQIQSGSQGADPAWPMLWLRAYVLPLGPAPLVCGQAGVDQSMMNLQAFRRYIAAQHPSQCSDLGTFPAWTATLQFAYSSKSLAAFLEVFASNGFQPFAATWCGPLQRLTT